MSALHHCSTWCRSFFFSLPFPQIISHHREHNGPVENNLPPSVTVTLATSDTVGGRKVWWSLRTVLSLAGAAGAASFRQQVLLIQFCLFFFITMFLWGTLEVITVTWLPANAARKINQKFPWLSSERTRRFGLSHCGCHSVVATYQKHMASPTGCSLSGGRRGRGGVHLFGRSLAIQPTTFCFEGQELSIRTLIS